MNRLKLRYSDMDVCQTGRWIYEVHLLGEATGQSCAGRSVVKSSRTGESYRKQIDAYNRVAQLNAEESGVYVYLRSVT